MNADGTCEQRFAPALSMSDVPVWSPSATAAPAVECSSAQLRVRASRTEIGLHDDVGFSVLVHNDGTRTLDATRVEIAATRGVVRIANGSDTCTRGREIVCTIGPLARGGDRTLELTGTPAGAGAGFVRYTVHVVWDGPSDVTPTADIATVAATIAPCDVVGTWEGDYLVGTPRADRICGRPGADRILGGRGNDRIEAGSGADTVTGGPGRDTIDGGGGGDLILVQDGERDTVDCGTEQDTVVADQFDVLKHCEHVSRIKTRRAR
jgi:Ca2+-binding RTX toxin-like protein